MKNDVFEKLLEDWFVVNMNRIIEGGHGDSKESKMAAFSHLEERRKVYKEDFKKQIEEIILILKTLRDALPLLISKLEFEDSQVLLEKRLK